MDHSAKSFFLKSVKGYPCAKCHTCKYRTNHAMLVSFRFFKKNGTPTYEFWYTRHNTPAPKAKFTIQDGHLVCQKCCGFKKRATAKMEGHTYTWVDRSVTRCPPGSLGSKKKYDQWVFDSIKLLKQQVKDLQNELRKNSNTVCIRGSLHQRNPNQSHDIRSPLMGTPTQPVHKTARDRVGQGEGVCKAAAKASL